MYSIKFALENALRLTCLFHLQYDFKGSRNCEAFWNGKRWFSCHLCKNINFGFYGTFIGLLSYL